MAERPGPKGEAARARLDGPEVPDALVYLWERFVVLDAMRTHGMAGPNPVTPAAIRAAAALYDWTLTPLEVDAIRVLDGAIRHPDVGTEKEAPEPLEVPAWPDKKEEGADG